MKVKRTVSIAMLIIAVLAMTVTPALAGGDNHRRRWEGQRFSLIGEVEAVDDGGQSITVLVLRGSRWVKDSLGDSLVIATDEDTRFRRYGDDPGVFITPEDVAPEHLVSVSGIVLADAAGEKVFLAKRVTVDIPFECDSAPGSGGGNAG